MPACPAPSCAANSASETGSASAPRPIGPARRPSCSASGRPIPRPAADPRSGRADRTRTPRSRRPRPGRRRRAPACVNTGIWRWIRVTPLSVRRAPPVSSNTRSCTILAPKRVAARRSASANSLSSSCEPTTSSQRFHCFQTRYWARPSASIERVGAVWITLARQSCSRRPVVDRAGIEQHGSAIADRVGGLQQRIRGKIGDDEADVAIGERNRRLGRVVAVLEPNFFQGEVLVQELAGGVVVLDREPGAGDAVVLAQAARPATASA